MTGMEEPSRASLWDCFPDTSFPKRQGAGDNPLAYASIGLATMLFGVSGSCEDIDATSLPVEFEPGPPSEKFT